MCERVARLRDHRAVREGGEITGPSGDSDHDNRQPSASAPPSLLAEAPAAHAPEPASSAGWIYEEKYDRWRCCL